MHLLPGKREPESRHAGGRGQGNGKHGKHRPYPLPPASLLERLPYLPCLRHHWPSHLAYYLCDDAAVSGTV